MTISAKPRTVPIAEVFGPTIQGEGALAGKPTYFIRVGGCDFDCGWCDSAHAVLPENVRGLPRLTAEQIFDQLTALPIGPAWVTISGGNPGLYDLTELVAFCQRYRIPRAEGGAGFLVAVETQGSKWQEWFRKVDLLTISPKPPSSGLPVADSLDYLEAFMVKWSKPVVGIPDMTALKVVVFDEADYEFAKTVHARYPWVPFYLSTGTAMGGLRGTFVPPAFADEGHNFDKFKQIRESVAANGDMVSARVGNVTSWWTQQGLSDDERSLLNRYRWLADKVKADPTMADAAVFPQLHVLLWGHTKGV